MQHRFANKIQGTEEFNAGSEIDEIQKKRLPCSLQKERDQVATHFNCFFFQHQISQIIFR